tara:strand:- start:571 stop:858 length:288 start_codon:yes stop_codon:yes gene_type:complete
MNSTNAIEKALQQKISEECREIVDKFVNDVEKLSDKYGGSMFYEFQKDATPKSENFHVQGTHGVTSVLHRMLLANHGNNMLKVKSQELIKKLELI